MNIKNLINKVNKYIKDDKDLVDNSIDIIFYNKKTKDYYINVSNYDDMGYFTYKDNELSEYNHIFDWSYSIDENIFYFLEEGYDIEYITDDVHKGIWFELDTLCIEDIQYQKGFKRYLDFCKEHNITNETLDEKVGGNPTPNIYESKFLFPVENEMEL